MDGQDAMRQRGEWARMKLIRASTFSDHVPSLRFHETRRERMRGRGVAHAAIVNRLLGQNVGDGGLPETDRGSGRRVANADRTRTVFKTRLIACIPNCPIMDPEWGEMRHRRA